MSAATETKSEATARFTFEERRLQLAEQCRAVEHLGRALAGLYGDLITVYALESTHETIVDHAGKRTAAFMDLLGDMLNSTDAATDEDAWLDPIFERANAMWPDAGAAWDGSLKAFAGDLYAALDAAPNPTDYYGLHGWEEQRFRTDFSAWEEKRRAALAKARGEAVS